MNVSTVPAKVHHLIGAFTTAPDDRLDAAFQELAGALWRDGVVTGLAHPAVQALTARFAGLDDRRKGYLAVLFGLLAEAEYPAADGPVTAVLGEHLDTYAGLVDGRDARDPLCLALCYLLAHFPAGRERTLAAAGRAGLGEEDHSRLERALADLDAQRPVLGRVFPSPLAWRLYGAEGDFDRDLLGSMAPEQILRGWQDDTRTAFAGLGIKAYWAVCNWASPAATAVPAFTPGEQIPRAPETSPGAFAAHGAALRCPGCAGAFAFGPQRARCTGCEATYLIASGILDLTKSAAEDQVDDFKFTLAETPGLALFYEALARPNFLRICGSNWDDAVTHDVEDAYITRHVRPVDGPVLDLAAGAGRWTRTLADTVGAERVIALDLNGPMLSVLRTRLTGVPALMSGATSLPFNDASLGAVLCWNALQAFHDDAPAAIAEIGRCLRPGGTFTLMTYRNSDDPLYRHFVASHTPSQHAGGPRPFDLITLKQWLADAGLQVRQEEGPGTFVFITAERVG
ncbi:methyltransferase domain-containing protein [Streptomyces sp. NPDC059063]|uniref:methyltransferase domain-containing protein n=1 Tax=unclassified Streptomyces TaxID=2593676 RepID=UPI0036C074D1